MHIYKELAKVYDLFMADVPYEDWANYLDQLLQTHKHSKLILELGCGTGNITTLLREKNYDMIGIDISSDMLMLAREKNNDILYLNQDMRNFELYGTVDACICICDSFNYILEDIELISTFKLVNNYLNPKGLFIFDILTEYKYNHILANNSFSHLEKNSAYIWENYYDPNKKINEYYTNIFIEEKNGLYKKYEEFHYQKAYSQLQIEYFLKEANLTLLNVYDAFTLNKPKKDSERLMFIAQENGK